MYGSNTCEPMDLQTLELFSGVFGFDSIDL